MRGDQLRKRGVQALTTPLAGIAGNIVNRMHLIAAGTALSAAMYIGLGAATTGIQVVRNCSQRMAMGCTHFQDAQLCVSRGIAVSMGALTL